MIRKAFLSSLFCYFCACSLTAQTSTDPLNDHFDCGIFEATQEFFEAHPEMVDVAREENARLEAFTQEFSTTSSERDDEIYVIPVVFHVIHMGGPENISDEQIYDAINVMNEDFNASNPGISNVLSEFEEVVANVGFEFRLARLDPNGNCTDGIIRTYNDATYSGGENLKQLSPTWDRTSYLNIWVCNTIENGAAGYSQYPGNVTGPGGAQTDGIVVLYNYVGSITPSNETRSHTLTHEAGHWANLIHPWGNSNEPGVESNCNIDDQVSDTPNTVGYTSCTLGGESCGSLDNVQNFMDYSYCTEMFTEGQKNRMRAAMESSTAGRNQLWSEANLIETGVFGPAVICQADFDANEKVVCEGSEITFDDESYNGITEWNWSFVGGTPETSTEQHPTVVYDSPGDYAVTLTVGNGSDQMTVVKEDFVHVLPLGEHEIGFYSESFEDFTSTDNNGFNWFSTSADGDNDVRWKLTDEASYTGDKSFYVNGRENGDNHVEYFDSPTFDLSNLPEDGEDVVMSFKYAHARRSGASDDQLRVLISRNCGETWIQRVLIEQDDLGTISSNNFSAWFPSSQDEWTEVVIPNITPIFFTEDFRVRFEFTSYRGNNIFIDDINMAYGATSVEKLNISSNLRIYPNPASESVIIEFEANSSKPVTISIHDLSGRKVKNVTRQNELQGTYRKEFTVADLSAGVYFVRINAGGNTLTRKLIVQ